MLNPFKNERNIPMNEMQKVMRKVRFETEAERYDRECNDYEYEQLQRDWPDNL